MSNAQTKLDLLRRLPANKLRAKLPAWARNVGAFVKPFEPDLRQFIPRGPITTLTNEPHRAWVFEFSGRNRIECALNPSDPEQYVKGWDLRNGFKPHPVEWIKPVNGSYG